MKPGEILSFQDTDGYKVVKLNKKDFMEVVTLNIHFEVIPFDEEH